MEPRIIIGVACFIAYEDNLLLSKRLTKFLPNVYGSAGGKKDFGHTLTETVIKETLEETGIDITGKFYQLPIMSDIVYQSEQAHVHCFWYVHKVKNKINVTHIEKDANGNPKSTEWKWYSLKDLENMPIMEDSLFVFKEYLDKYQDEEVAKNSPFRILESKVK